jgi:hypothetical protein
LERRQEPALAKALQTQAGSRRLLKAGMEPASCPPQTLGRPHTSPYGEPIFVGMGSADGSIARNAPDQTLGCTSRVSRDL